MQIENKRIHGRLLLLTGVFHMFVILLPGICGEQLLEFSNHGFFNISKGLAGFPFFGGSLNYENFAVFWFFYMGPLLLMYGHVIDTIERQNNAIPRQIAINFLIVSLIGAYMMPISGMTFLLIPQASYMLIRSNKHSD